MKHFKYKREDPKPRRYSSRCYDYSVEHFKLSAKRKKNNSKYSRIDQVKFVEDSL